MGDKTLLGLLEGKGLLKSLFLKTYVGRECWASTLGCDRTTIWRYEQHIIAESIPSEYKVSKFLDGYQRYILALIIAHKRGWVDGKKREYSEIKRWLIDNRISREQFEEIVSPSSISKSPEKDVEQELENQLHLAVSN